MKLSVVTVCYNDLDALKKTVDSVLIQGSKDFEMIIQDGGSTDGTIE
jgi:glycosyltransferase involved in cell wall biosynthesis